MTVTNCGVLCAGPLIMKLLGYILESSLREARHVNQPNGIT